MILEFYGAYSAFINAAILGVFFGFVYDIFRILRISRIPYLAPKGKFYELITPKKQAEKQRKKPPKKIFALSDTVLTFIEDIIFWIVASLGEILFIYHVNGGVIRVYFILCTFAGAALYFFTAGKITMYFSVRIIFLIRCLLYWTFYIIIYPVRLILLFTKNTLVFIADITVKPIIQKTRKHRAKVYSRKRILRILAQSKKGFFTYD